MGSRNVAPLRKSLVSGTSRLVSELHIFEMEAPMARTKSMQIEAQEPEGHSEVGSTPSYIFSALTAKFCSPRHRSEVTWDTADLFSEWTLPSGGASDETAWSAARFLFRTESAH